MGDAQPQSLGQVLDTLVDSADNTDGDRPTVRDLLETFDSRSYGPLLLVPALIALLPTGGIPGVPTFAATIIAIVAAQMLFLQRRPWLPRRLLDVEIPHEKLTRGVQKARRWVKPVDALTRQRLTALTRQPMTPVIALICIALAAMMVPLELVPFAAAAPAGTITVLAFGLTARDGLLIAIGLVLTLGCGALVWWLVV